MKGMMFKSAMVVAIREDLKTETTRIEKSLTEINQNPDNWYSTGIADGLVWGFYNRFPGEHVYIKPRYLPGETVYVKETWAGQAKDDGTPICDMSQGVVFYKVTTEDSSGITFLRGKWRSPLFMPEWATRTFLKILSATPQRLHDMTEQDARAEGFNSLAEFVPYFDQMHPGSYARNEWAIRYRFEKVGKADISRKAFLQLPVEERRKILSEQAKALAEAIADSQAKEDLRMME